MKKILFVIMAIFMSFSMANAQTVEQTGVFSNMYLGINGGALTPMIPTEGTEFLDVVNHNIALELGKNITPAIGFSIEGQAISCFNSENIKIDRSNVVGSVKVNLMNLFGGYKGYPRLVEVSLVPGIGWCHNYAIGVEDPNYLTYNTMAQIDFNLGKKCAWQINIKSGVVWTSDYQGTGFYGEKAEIKANIGVTYKFKNRKTNSNNFVICPYTVKQEDYDNVCLLYNECLSKSPDTIVVEKEVVVERVIEKIVTKPSETLITFPFGSSSITDTELIKVRLFANRAKDEGCDVLVIGSADTKTGSKEYNEKLANERAVTLATELSRLGVSNIKFETRLDLYDNPEASRSAMMIAE